MASLTSPLAGGLSPPRSLPSPPFFSESRSEIAGCSRADSESEVDEWSDLGRWISACVFVGKNVWPRFISVVGQDNHYFHYVVVGSNLL